ncbi:hypothetical protein BJ508DRAFT_326735 [Ascobolus immersus RN42]|uniref:DUF7918 domain-containing protein n=1 Tax=Ascobolus immersus RN42 TaxID=1160509 RepID=A0A3N4IHK1_ASCIM|nr:hypothetical protein BJ508DRAFT_326735 [Ascobolus immersus RN42]
MVRMGPFDFTIIDHNGDPLKEYPDPEPTSKDHHSFVSVYVQTPPPDEPQTFEIQIEPVLPVDLTTLNTKGYDFFATFDGVENQLGTRLSESNILKGDLTTYIDTFDVHLEDGTFQGRELSFGAVSTTDDAKEVAPGTVDKDQFGTIVVDMWGVIRTYYDLKDRKGDPEEGCLNVSKVHESDVKATAASHSVRQGDITIEGITVQDRASDYGPTCRTVQFKYRSEAALRTLWVIPPIMPEGSKGTKGDPISIDDSDTELDIDKTDSEPQVQKKSFAAGIKRERSDSTNEKGSRKRHPILGERPVNQEAPL